MVVHDPVVLLYIHAFIQGCCFAVNCSHEELLFGLYMSRNKSRVLIFGCLRSSDQSCEPNGWVLGAVDSDGMFVVFDHAIPEQVIDETAFMITPTSLLTRREEHDKSKWFFWFPFEELHVQISSVSLKNPPHDRFHAFVE